MCRAVASADILYLSKKRGLFSPLTRSSRPTHTQPPGNSLLFQMEEGQVIVGWIPGKCITS